MANRSKATNYVRENLSEEQQILICYIQEEFIRMKEELKNDMTALFGTKLKEVEDLKSQVEVLTEKVNKLEDMIDDQDQYERRDCLILSGPALPPVTSNENCATIACDVIKTTCNVNLQRHEISTAHRLGKRPITQQPDKRNIIIKFCRRDIKEDIYKSSKSQPRPTQLYVNESLTPTRRHIYQTLRHLRKNHPTQIAGCSTYDGKIYAYTKVANNSNGQTQRDRRHLIKNYDGLKKFCEDYVKIPMELFLNTWEQRN